MTHKSDLIASDIVAYLKSHEEKTLLRFITCGSVDDGKSTLIGRLLYESNMIFEDQLTTLKADSKKMGTQGENIDFALLVDGLASEREQGITIDVAYRFFSTDKRKFIVADTPGHEQYTRNMATGASTAELAVILVDARKGILSQTRRHSFICSTLGIKNVVLAVNKMDLMSYSQDVFNQIDGAYREFAAELPDFDTITSIPMSALIGDNIVKQSKNLDWYFGPTLMNHLETINIESAMLHQPFRMPVQWVNRPNSDFRGFCGQISSGTIKIGDKIKVLPSATQTSVNRIVTMDGELQEAIVGQSVTLTLDDEIDISRGDILCDAEQPCEIGNQFEATMLWMSEQRLHPGRTYTLKTGTEAVQASVNTIKYKVDVNTLAQGAAVNLELNEIGRCTISLDRRIAFDAYQDNRETGGFILIDKLTNATVGMGTFHFALRRSSNIHWQSLTISKETRSQQKDQQPCVLWFTGLSGSGKSTIANIVELKLVSAGIHTMLLDGDNVRHGLNRDLGFTNTDRVENIRRIAEVSKLMTEAGLITLVSFISPFEAERRMAKELMEDGEFLTIYVNTPLEVAEKRDVKGLYKKARAGEIKNFTAIDSPYEPPVSPDITVATVTKSAEECADEIIAYLIKNQFVKLF